MRTDVLKLAADLAHKGEPFVMAIVVRREPASSAQIGNTALITERGDWHGWLGGSCIQSTVVREAMAALDVAEPRLISLTPNPDGEHRAGITAFPMTCHSGGSVDIYLEPVLPAPCLLVFGVSPAAQALARLGKVMGYTVDVVDPEADRDAFPEADRIVETIGQELFGGQLPRPGRLFAVVATLGQRDEEAIKSALSVDPAYLGVVASRKRFAQIRETLVAGGTPTAALDGIVNPAGVDIGARAPEEVALSILAEIVKVRRAAAETKPSTAAGPSPALEARDPICGMDVTIATATHRAEHGGRTYYFCCGGCRERFLASPDRYALAGVSEARAVTPEIQSLLEAMERVGYIADEAIATALFLAREMRKPLLVEGEAGGGKTELAKVFARLLDTELIRLQCYEGLDVNTALYEWNYPRQLLRVRMAERDGQATADVEGLIFDRAYLLERPLLRAITSRDGPPVLLIDEIDRADDGFEAFLLEVLSDFQVTIPELGTIRAEHIPHVILTSNRSREIGDALRRRCLYLYVEHPALEKEVRILRARVPGASDQLARQIGRAMQTLRQRRLSKAPGVAESIDWAHALVRLNRQSLDSDVVGQTLGCFLKDRHDIEDLDRTAIDALVVDAIGAEAKR